MVDLNDSKSIAEIDKSNAYASVTRLASQCKQAWEETQEIQFPSDYKNINNIVLCGMGGSAYAALIIKALFGDSLKVPFELVNGYDLPPYVDQNTLVLLSSYSGSTEETLSCGKQALERKSKISAVANGSKLEEFTKQNNIPSYIFDAKFNPAGQPRLGQGYMIFGHIGVLSSIGLISPLDVIKAIEFLDGKGKEIENDAMEMSRQFIEKIPVFVAAGHLSGNAHIMRNQTNENSKNFATYGLIPELNHHLMEGLAHPKHKILKFLFLRSLLYDPIITKRFDLTKDVVSKNEVESLDLNVKGDNQIQQMLYALAFGGYLTFYLAIEYGLDPSPIPWVDYFKDQLGKVS